MQFQNINGVAFVPWPVRDKHEGFYVGRVNFSTTRSLIKADLLYVGDITYLLHEVDVDKFHDRVNQFHD